MAIDVRMTATLSADQEIADSQNITVDNFYDLNGDPVLGSVLGSTNMGQQITFSSASAIINVTINGEDADGSIVSETLIATAATTHVTTGYFRKVDSILVNAASGQSTTVAWKIASGGITRSVVINWRSAPFELSVVSTPPDGSTSSTATGKIEYTTFDPLGDYDGAGFSNAALWVDVTGVGGATYSDLFLGAPLIAARGELIHVDEDGPIPWLFMFLQGDTYT